MSSLLGKFFSPLKHYQKFHIVLIKKVFHKLLFIIFLFIDINQFYVCKSNLIYIIYIN